MKRIVPFLICFCLVFGGCATPKQTKVYSIQPTNVGSSKTVIEQENNVTTISSEKTNVIIEKRGNVTRIYTKVEKE